MFPDFRKLLMYSPNGTKDGIQIIPFSDVAAKDEFLNIPSNVGGFGDVEKAANVFVRNELLPLQKRLEEINDWINEKVIIFKDYKL